MRFSAATAAALIGRRKLAHAPPNLGESTLLLLLCMHAVSFGCVHANIATSHVTGSTQYEYGTVAGEYTSTSLSIYSPHYDYILR